MKIEQKLGNLKHICLSVGFVKKAKTVNIAYLLSMKRAFQVYEKIT